jgi:hypothetical protein
MGYEREKESIFFLSRKDGKKIQIEKNIKKKNGYLNHGYG